MSKELSYESVKNRRFLACGVVAMLVFVIGDRISFVESKSIPFRYAFQAFGPPTKGDYVREPVQFWLIADGKRSTLTKKIACFAGDSLTFDGKNHYCNGAMIDTINLRQTDDGRPLPIFQYNGRIPKGKVYLLGTHYRSFDSRYLGFFNLSDAVKVWGII